MTSALSKCPFDAKSLLHRCMGDAGFCELMLQKFADRAANQLAALERAARAANCVELAREAHTLKGIALNLSADELRASATRLEQAARTGQCDCLGELISEVRVQVIRCLESMPWVLAEIAERR